MDEVHSIRPFPPPCFPVRFACQVVETAATRIAGRAGFPAYRFIGLSSPVTGATWGLERSPELADRNVCLTDQFRCFGGGRLM